jgi:hypothetical protein
MLSGQRRILQEIYKRIARNCGRCNGKEAVMGTHGGKDSDQKDTTYTGTHRGGR